VQYWDDDVEDIVDIKDGEVPLPDMINPWEQIKNGRMTAILQPGKWRVRCRCEGEFKGTSKPVTVDYNVLERTDTPDLFAYGGFCFPSSSCI
jgi:hypothetical protein